jgi:hypothetical protein
LSASNNGDGFLEFDLDDSNVAKGVQDEILSKGFYDILTVLMMIHSIFKLGELCQNFELCRRSYNIFKKCLIDSLRLTAIIAIIAGAFAGINQVLNPKKIEFWDSVTEVYDQSFSLDFVSSSANST